MDAELEAKLLEQEHRSIRVVQNFLSRKKWPADDPRRIAVKTSLLWWLLSPATAAAAGGAIAAGTLVVMTIQTQLLREQNSAFREQNEKLQAQIEIQRQSELARRRADAISHIFELDKDGMPRSNRKTRAEAVAEYVQLERERIRDPSNQNKPRNARNKITASDIDLLLKANDLTTVLMSKAWRFSHRVAQIDLKGVNLSGLDLSGRDLSGVDLSGADLRSTKLQGSILRKSILSNIVVGNTDFTRADLRESTVIFENNSEVKKSLLLRYLIAQTYETLS